MKKFLSTIFISLLMLSACIPGVVNDQQASNDQGDAIDTSDWRTYRNEEFGFELKYPKEWNFEEKINTAKGYFISNGISAIAILPQGEFDRGLPSSEPSKRLTSLSDRKAIERIWDMSDGRQLIFYNFTDQISAWSQCGEELLNCNRIDISTDFKDKPIIIGILSTFKIDS